MDYRRFLLFVSIAISLNNWAQDSYSFEKNHRDVRFKNISLEEGLSQSTVYCILQDSKGFMWFGTREGGLNKYDGYNFTVYKNSPNNSLSLSSNEVISIQEDHKGQLWVGTRKGGLNKFNSDYETFRQFKHDVNDTNSIRGNTVNVVFEDSEKNLWIGTNSGLDLYKDGIFLHDQIYGTKGQHIVSMDEDNAGNLYISDKNGLLIWDKANNSTKYFLYKDVSEETRISNYSAPVFIDAEDKIWIGSSNGLMSFNKDKEVFEDVGTRKLGLDSETRKIIEDSEGNLWIGTFKGLYKLNKENKTLSRYQKDENIPESLSHNSIYSIFEDRSGAIWIGSWSGGINVYSSYLWKFDHKKHQGHNEQSLSNNVVSSFEEDENGVWIGTELGGLNFQPNGSIDFMIYKSLPNVPGTISSNHIKCLHHDSKGHLWIGTFGGGVNLMDKRTKRFTHYLGKAKIYSIQEDAERNLWFGSLNGLYRLNSARDEWKHFKHDPEDESSLSHNFITTIYLAHNKDLWIGTKEAGLMKYNRESESFTRFRNRHNDSASLSSDYIISISEDNHNHLLIGTNNGLNMYDPERNVFMSSIINNLPDNNINGVLSDNRNHYWVSTNKGITKISNNASIVNYDISDGLQSNEFNRNAFFKARTGKFYFGGINGYNSFYPDSIRQNEEIPSIVFTEFKISNHTVKPGDASSPLTNAIANTKEIVLNHDQSDFSLGFVALNFISPEKNQYAYKLEGYNNNWIYCGISRNATYTNIAPGEYTFKVKASNNDNVWNEQGVAIKLIIKPPFWKTPIAYLLYALTITLLLFLLRVLITNRIETQNAIKNERIEKKRIEELNQLKLRFFTNISHEFRTPLTLISGPISKIASFHTDNAEYQYLLKIVQNNVKRMLILVNELMDFRKAENEKYKLRVKEVEVVKFIDRIVESFSDLAAGKKIRIEQEYQLDHKTLFWFDQGIIDKIIFNLLSNAIKHSSENQKIIVLVESKDGWSKISIKDFGKGIPDDKLDKVFDRFYQVEGNEKIIGSGIGLAFVKRLTETHRGTIHVESEIGVGTNFVLSFPIEKGAYTKDELAEEKENELHKQIDTGALKLAEPPILDSSGKKSNTKILIVEDNDELRGFLSNHFGQYDVFTASNGKEGCEMADREVPDLIVSDIMMPEMDGLEMCKILRSQISTSHIPVVFLTAKTEGGQKIEGIETGADAYIEKPFDINLLSAVVVNILKQRRILRSKFAQEPNLSINDLDLTVYEDEFCKKMTAFIEENISNPELSVEVIASEMGLSRSQLFRKTKSVFEVAPGEIIRIERLKYSKKLLLELKYNVNEVADLSGFTSNSYFITSFKKYYGITPNDFLQDVKNEAKLKK